MTRNFGGNLREGRKVGTLATGAFPGKCNLPAHRLGIEASLQRGVLASSILGWSLGLVPSIFEALYHLI
jgi:hypothetical protein